MAVSTNPGQIMTQALMPLSWLPSWMTSVRATRACLLARWADSAAGDDGHPGLAADVDDQAERRPYVRQHHGAEAGGGPGR